jgi:hypothetical protein
MGDYTKAEPLYERAAAIKKKRWANAVNVRLVQRMHLSAFWRFR